MHDIELWCEKVSFFKVTDELISKFQSLIAPSSCPDATKQQLIKYVMQLNSECSGESIYVNNVISLASQSLIVLSRLHVIILGSSGILSLVIFSNFYGSKVIILRIGP